MRNKSFEMFSVKSTAKVNKPGRDREEI